MLNIVYISFRIRSEGTPFGERHTLISDGCFFGG